MCSLRLLTAICKHATPCFAAIDYWCSGQSTNVDNTVTAKPTPVPMRPIRPTLAALPPPDANILKAARPMRHPARFRQEHAGAPTVGGTPTTAKKLSVSPTGVHQSSPVEYPPPKTPGIRRHGNRRHNAVANSGMKSKFSMLNNTSSDDIVEFDDKSRKTSPIGTPPQPNAAENLYLSKTALGKRTSPVEGQSGGRKRLVSASPRSRNLGLKSNIIRR
jgi:hypothetical protein